MLIITFAIVAAIIFLSVEIPVFINRREEVDLLIIIASLFVLIGGIAILYLR